MRPIILRTKSAPMPDGSCQQRYVYVNPEKVSYFKPVNGDGSYVFFDGAAALTVLESPEEIMRALGANRFSLRSEARDGVNV